MQITEETLQKIKQLIGVQEGISLDAPILQGKTIRQTAHQIQELLTPQPTTTTTTTKHRRKTKP